MSRVFGYAPDKKMPYFFGTFFENQSGTVVTCWNGHADKYESFAEAFEVMLHPDRGTVSRGRKSRAEVHWLTHGGGGQDFSLLAARLHPVLAEKGLGAELIPFGNRIGAIRITTPEGDVVLEDFWHASKSENPQDAEELYRMVGRIRQADREYFGVSTGLTVTLTARKAWRVTIPEGHKYFRQHPDKEAFLRKACIGAIVFPGDDLNVWVPQDGEELAAVTIDRNGAFAAEMRKGGYPVDAGIWTREFMQGYCGIYECEVTCPESVEFPFVHMHWTQDKVERRALRYGEKMTAYLTDEAYLRAQQRGYKVKVIEGLFFKKTEDIFSAFIAKCDRLEHDMSLPEVARKRAKHFRNHLNGNFNMGDTAKKIMLGKPPLGSEPWFDEDTGMPLPGWIVEEKTERPHVQPAWYSITVQRQMLEMERVYSQVPQGSRGHGDTDSVTMRPGCQLDVEFGTGYGQWKTEKNWLTLQGYAKNYAGITSDGTVVTKVSGVPRETIKRHVHEFARAMGGEKLQVQWESVRWQDALAKEPSAGLLMRTRTLGTPESLSNWEVDPVTMRVYPLGRTKPVYVPVPDNDDDLVPWFAERHGLSRQNAEAMAWWYNVEVHEAAA